MKRKRERGQRERRKGGKKTLELLASSLCISIYPIP